MAEKKENSNLKLYNDMRSVPKEAIKQIGAGRLKGMSDINPMWRIKKMTEAFGICGIGWKYTITKQWIETVGPEVKAFCNIDVFIKQNGEWSDAIPGTGGSALASNERNGIYVNDECYKMALTDALSVAMKSLGMAADIYFNKDADLGTKYAVEEQQASGNLKPTMTTEQAAISEMKQQTTREGVTAVWNRYPTLHANGGAFYKATLEQGILINK